MVNFIKIKLIKLTMDALVTGASGYIGKSMVTFLLKKNHNVTVITRDAKEFPKGVKVIIADIADKSALSGCCSGIDVVIHLAAETSSRSRKPYSDFYSANVLGTTNLALEAAKSKVRFFAHFSTMSAFGRIDDLENPDLRQRHTPNTNYSISKYESEKIVSSLCKKHGIPFCIIRPSMVVDFNEPDRDTKRLFRFVKLGIVPMLGNGRNRFNVINREELIEKSSELIMKRRTGIHLMKGSTVTYDGFIGLIMKKVGRRRIIRLKIPSAVLRPAVYLQEKVLIFLGIDPYISISQFNNMKGTIKP
jgi:nucleoside-diphosphate-sugar epimerase